MKPKGPWLLVWLMAATVVALLAALLLTEGDDGVDVDALLADAPRAVDEHGSARLDMAVTVDQEGIDVSVDGSGAVDFAAGAGWFTVEQGSTSTELRTNGETLFVLPSGQTTWLAVHADEAELGAFATGPSQAIAFVDLLRGAAADVDDRGTVEIDGAETRHIRLTVDVDDAVAAASEEHRPAIEALRAFAAEEGSLPLEVWIDERNLPVRQRMRGQVEGVAVVITTDLTEWGEPLDVAIPPEGAVRDIEADELAQVFGASPPG